MIFHEFQGRQYANEVFSQNHTLAGKMSIFPVLDLPTHGRHTKLQNAILLEALSGCQPVDWSISWLVGQSVSWSVGFSKL